MHLQGVILKESKDSLELVIEMERQATGDSQIDQNLRKQASEMREAAKEREKKTLQDLDNAFKKKEHDIDKSVSQRMFQIENKRLQELKESQLREKREMMDKHLPQDSSLREVMKEIADDEEKEILDFKREQEIERQRREEELAKQEAQLLKEIKDQSSKMEKLDKEAKRLTVEEQKREKQQLIRKKRAEAAKSSGDFIDKLKKDLEKVNEQLDSAINQEKARQLTLMQRALQGKLQEAERLRAEEEAVERAEAEKEGLFKA